MIGRLLSRIERTLAGDSSGVLRRLTHVRTERTVRVRVEAGDPGEWKIGNQTGFFQNEFVEVGRGEILY